jgi:hypothetical protein
VGHWYTLSKPSAMVVTKETERRFRVYKEKPGFRPGPRVESRAFARGRGVLSTAYSPLSSFLNFVSHLYVRNAFDRGNKGVAVWRVPCEELRHCGALRARAADTGSASPVFPRPQTQPSARTQHILLATSQDVIRPGKRRFSTRWMTWDRKREGRLVCEEATRLQGGTRRVG